MMLQFFDDRLTAIIIIIPYFRLYDAARSARLQEVKKLVEEGEPMSKKISSTYATQHIIFPLILLLLLLFLL